MTSAMGGRSVRAAVVGLAMAMAATAAPAAALESGGDLEADWSMQIAAYDDDGVEVAPSSIAVVGGVVHVADGARIARHDRATGASVGAWVAPAGVTVHALAAGPGDTLFAAGEKGDDGWVGRFDGSANPDWSEVITGGSAAELIAADVVGTTLYVAGGAPGAFGREVMVRRYDDIDTAGPDVAWTHVGSTGAGDVVHDMAATSTAVYVGGSSAGPFGSATVWRFDAGTGAITVKQLTGAAASFFAGEVRGVDADGDRVYVAYSGISRTAAGDAGDAHIARLDATTLATDWEEMVGRTFGTLPDLGDQDVARDVAIDGAAVLLVGSTDASLSDSVDGLTGPGGFIARYTDGGTSATRQFLVRTAALATVEVDAGDALVLSGPTIRGEVDCGGAGATCSLAAIDDVGSGPAPPPGHGFSDVPAGAFYADAVAWLKAEGITTGTSATTFSPADPVTRGQMATFLFRFDQA